MKKEEVYQSGEREVTEALLEGEENKKKKEREPEESAFQKEMMELEKEHKAFMESTKTLGSLWSLARQEKQVETTRDKGEDEEELQAAQVKERMNSALSKAESAFLVAEQLAEKVIEMKLNEIKGIDIQSANEAGKIGVLLKDIENVYLMARKNLSETESLKQESAKFHEQYKKTSLSEAGFGSFEEARDAHYDLDRESISLQYDIGRRKNDYFGIGRFINKEKIKDLEQKIEDLKPKISELGALRELGEEKPKSFYDRPIKEKLQLEAKEICQVGLDKILGRLTDLLKGISFEEPTALLDPDLKEKILQGKEVDGEAYRYVMNVIQNNEAIAQGKAVIDSFWNTVNNAKNMPLDDKAYRDFLMEYRRSPINQFKERGKAGNQARIRIQMSRDTFGVYEAIKNSKEAAEIVGEDRLKEADNFLAKNVLEDLMEAQRKNPMDTIEFGERLFHFKEPSIIPFAVMNAYREPYAAQSYSSDMTLSRFADALSKEEIEKVTSLDIPGAARIIELVKNNPETFNKKKIENKEEGREFDNPVHQEIQRELEYLAEHYLKNGDKASKIFTLDLVRRLETVPDEIYEREAAILLEPYDVGLHGELLKSLFSRARDFGGFNDKRSMDIILENYDAVDKNTKEAIRKENYQIASFLLRGESPDSLAIEKTSKIVGIEKGELERTLQFLGELRRAGCYSSLMEGSDIYAYRDLYKRGEALKEDERDLFIKEIKKSEEFASEYGNGIRNAESLLAFTEIPENTRFLIQEFNKDFRYRVSSARRGELGGNDTVLDGLLTDKKLAEEIAKGERGEYQARVSQEVGMGFLNEGNIAHDLLENIKEKGWMTIQTYNRLYAARRAFTGFESYAYSPRQGEKHPVINVSFYGNMFSDKGESLLEGGGAKDENGFLQNGSISGKEAIKVYAPNFELYQKKVKEYQALESQEAREAFSENFKWNGDHSEFSNDPEYEKIADTSLPIGASPNGHTRFYATPYGIVSGCVSQEGIFEAESQNLGVWLVTGHKEMLKDFMEKQEAHKKFTEEIKKPKAGGFEIEFENTDIPPELEKAILPANISVGEFLLNLHFEQYLHSGLKPRQDFLKELMQKFNEGEITVIADDAPLKLDDKIPLNSKIRVVGQEQEEILAKAA